MTIIWAPAARTDLRNLLLYIAKDNVDAALRMQDRIEGAVAKLDDMPERTRLGRLANTRELVISGTPYLVILRVTGEQVEVARVMHGAQKWPPEED